MEREAKDVSLFCRVKYSKRKNVAKSMRKYIKNVAKDMLNDEKNVAKIWKNILNNVAKDVYNIKRKQSQECRRC